MLYFCRKYSGMDTLRSPIFTLQTHTITPENVKNEFPVDIKDQRSEKATDGIWDMADCVKEPIVTVMGRSPWYVVWHFRSAEIRDQPSDAAFLTY